MTNWVINVKVMSKWIIDVKVMTNWVINVISDELRVNCVTAHAKYTEFLNNKIMKLLIKKKE